MFVVIKSFRTAMQRFTEGARLYRSFDLTPHTMESLISLGYVENQLDTPAPKAKSPKTPDAEPTPESLPE
jgi:hypothetical protein